MKENCFGEKLQTILDLVYEQGVKDCDYSDEPTMETDEAHKAIIELIKTELLPESPRTGMEIDDVLAEVDGFENCLQIILSKLEGDG